MRRVLSQKFPRSLPLKLQATLATSSFNNSDRLEKAALDNLKQAYREHGHRLATVDPLGIWEREPVEAIRELRPDSYGLDDNTETPVKSAYCGNLSLQAASCPYEQADWLYEQFENLPEITDENRKYACKLMIVAQEFDKFLQSKFPSLKRYGGEGAEAMMPFLDRMFNELAIQGCKEAILGQAHRGRNNLLVTMLDLPAALMFRKIKGLSEFPEGTPEFYTGDVLSHLTGSTDRTFRDGNKIHLTMLPNPSHLEAVSPVAVGKSYARGGYKESCPVQVHGDGAFAGQGIIPETLQMCKIDGFNCGGSIHLVVNNQVAFSAERHKGRSSMYTTDLAVGLGLPIIRVNGKDIDAVLHAARIAAQFREKFQTDILVDLMCFRKYGHNEVDDPTFTNPVLYQAIRSLPDAPDRYAIECLERNIIVQEDLDSWKKEAHAGWNEDYKASDGYNPPMRWMQGKWSNMTIPEKTIAEYDTSYPLELLRTIGTASVTVDQEDFNVHPHLLKTHMKNRREKIASNRPLDWATAEAMAVGSLLHQGFDVRLVGQEAQRGTFSHRHWTFTDQTDHFKTFEPLNNMTDGQGKMQVVSSLLSEEAVMAFEYGTSVESPNRLSIWEAQFGDFHNVGQSIIDTFFASGEAKWMQQSSMVILLPHGYDGAGPEHSSCRIERWLQLTNSQQTVVDTEQSTNFSVVNPSNSAQYFHVLRRQMIRPYRKPLMVVAPKTLLRAPEACSVAKDMATGTKFQKIIGDGNLEAERVVFCSGRHYYTVRDKIRDKNDASLRGKVSLVRIEELSPFPATEISNLIHQYKNAKDFYYSQEEPRNAGAWSFMEPRLKHLLNVQLKYAGRPSLPSPAVGIGTMHKQQNLRVVTEPIAGLYS